MPSRRQVLASLGAVGVGSVAGCLGSVDTDAGASASDDDTTTDWPMANFGPMGQSYNPNAVGPREKPSEQWSTEVGWATGRVVVADGTVYVPTQTHLYALDAQTGEERWSVGPSAADNAPLYTSPAVNEGTVYVGTDSDGLLALAAEDGSEKWRYETGDDRTGVDVAPIADDVDDASWRNLLVASQDGVVHSLNLETREAEWTFEVYGRVSHLATYGTIVYAGTVGGEVYALYDGEGMWRRKLPGKITALALSDGSHEVIASTFGGGVFRLRDGAHAGRTAWHDEEGPVAQEAFVVAKGEVYGGDLARMKMLDERSGEVAWKLDGSFGYPPAAAGDTLYLGDEEGVTAYALGGGVGLGDFRLGGRRWHYPLKGEPRSGITVADGAVFVVDSGGENSSSSLIALE